MSLHEKTPAIAVPAHCDDAVSPQTARRPRCDRCRRPLSHCLCAHIPSLPNRTRVLVLQHPDEVKHPLNTAGLAVLGLQNAELRVGEHFPELERELSERGRAVLLFPAKEGREDRNEGCDQTSIRKQDGDEGRDPDRVQDGDEGRDQERVQDEDRCQNQSANQDRDDDSAPAPAVRAEDAYDLLIVPDGTWRKARRILRANPILQVLSRLSLAAGAPSEYRVRKATEPAAVSTLEAIVRALEQLEPGRSYEPLLAPFRALVQQQVEGMGEDVFRRHHMR